MPINKTQDTCRSIIRSANEKIIVILSITITIIFLFCSFLLVTPATAKSLPISSGTCASLVNAISLDSKWGAIIGIAFAMLWYVSTELIKKTKMKNQHPKRIIIILLKIARKFHIPIAILALGLALVHAYIEILNGLYYRFCSFRNIYYSIFFWNKKIYFEK